MVKEKDFETTSIGVNIFFINIIYQANDVFMMCSLGLFFLVNSALCPRHCWILYWPADEIFHCPAACHSAATSLCFMIWYQTALWCVECGYISQVPWTVIFELVQNGWKYENSYLTVLSILNCFLSECKVELRSPQNTKWKLIWPSIIQMYWKHSYSFSPEEKHGQMIFVIKTIFFNIDPHSYKL